MILLVSYASYKMVDMLGLNDFTLQEAVQEFYYPEDETFGTGDKFEIAASIISLDRTEGTVEDPTIATLKFYVKKWDSLDEEESNGSAIFTPVKTKACTTDNFNNVEGTNNESNFFALHPTSEVDLNIYGDHMKCID